MNLVKVNQSSNKYRLGDAILLDNTARNKIRNFPNTIGYDYLTATKWVPKLFDKDILTRVINEHIKKHNYKAPETEFAIHWRLHPHFEMNMNKLKEIIGDKEVTVCAAIHSNETRGLEKLNKFVKEDNVRLQSSSNPDKDFAFLFQAKKLITTQGQFSNLLYNLREDNRWHMAYYTDTYKP